MTGAYAQLAELRSRIGDYEFRRLQLRDERGGLALAAEGGDKEAIKRRDELRREIADLSQRIADTREAIPAAEHIARAEAQRGLQDSKRAKLARAAEALKAYDAAAAELAPIIENVAARIADLDRRAEEMVRNLRGLISSGQFDALHAQPVATHFLGRLVQLNVLARDLLPHEWDYDIQLRVPTLDRATAVWSRRVAAYVAHAQAELAPPDMAEAA